MTREPLTPRADLSHGDPDPRRQQAMQELIAAIPEYQIRAKMAEIKYRDIMAANNIIMTTVAEDSVSISVKHPDESWSFLSEDVVGEKL